MSVQKLFFAKVTARVLSGKTVNLTQAKRELVYPRSRVPTVFPPIYHLSAVKRLWTLWAAKTLVLGIQLLYLALLIKKSLVDLARIYPKP